MNSSIYNIITVINSSLKDLVTGARWQGVADSLKRDGKTQPVIDEKHAGIDDKFALVAYHNLGTLTSRIAAGSGYGNAVGDQVNLYANSLVVFLNRGRCQLYPDELLLHIQANIPELITMSPYKSVRVNITNTLLDREAVYNQEYTNSTFKLGKDQYLFKIYYTVETTFKKGCFKTCPQN